MSTNSDLRAITVGAYEAKTRFSELIARAEKGESFIVTKNGRPVARLTPMEEFNRAKAQKVADELRSLLAAQGPPISAEEAQKNWEQLKHDLDAEEQEWTDQWLSSWTPR